ncbi:MAG: DUF2203 family protein [Proteobacteria bacterium]|nr:DUF2203 family protein [Pseudomonadota bacterium]
MSPKRRWSLAGAESVLCDVRRHTEAAVQESEVLLARSREASDPAEAARAAAALRRVLSRWLRAMEALGVEARGPWRVEFETGDGTYCWSWPDEDLAGFRDAEGGDPTPIQ